MEENMKKKAYVKPKAVTVVFRVSDIVVTSGGSQEHQGEPFGMTGLGAALRNIDNNLPF